MKSICVIVTVSLLLLLGMTTAFAQEHSMSFFITSVGMGKAVTSVVWKEPMRTAKSWPSPPARAIGPGAHTSAPKRRISEASLRVSESGSDLGTTPETSSLRMTSTISTSAPTSLSGLP